MRHFFERGIHVKDANVAFAQMIITNLLIVDEMK